MFDLETRTTDPPLLVTATVSYSGAKPGFILTVSIFDLDSGGLVSGSGMAPSRPCDLQYALCSGGVSSPSGSENVRFLIAGFKQTMSLAIIAIFYDNSGSLVYDSESDYEFVITMASAFVLGIQVPYIVPVSVDGVSQPKGNAWLYLSPGVHSISVPDTVQVDNVTRMKFERWSDGVNETARTIYLNKQTTLAADYVLQYFLAVTDRQGNVTGAGWYNDGSNAIFSVPSTTMPMNGLMGLLGGKWKFEGWYENGEILTASTAGSMLMLRSHSVTSDWEEDYELPAIILIAIGLAVIIALTRRNLWEVLRKKAGIKNAMIQTAKRTRSEAVGKPRSVHRQKRKRSMSR